MSKHVLFHIVCGIVLAMFIISVSVTAALNMKFIYYSDIERYGLTEVSGLSAEELNEDYDELIDYNLVFGDDELKFPHFPMSAGAAKHFAEARTLFLFFQWGILIFGVLSVLLIAYGTRKGFGPGFLLSCSIITLALPAALGIFALTAWDRLFVIFHELSFGNDLWLFDPDTDPVINVLPDGFFFHEAIAIFGLVIAGGIVCLVTYIALRHRSSDNVR